MGGKFTWGNKAKHCWVMSTNFFVFKSLLARLSNVLPLHLKQTFPPIIWIFIEGEGDEIESRLPLKSFLLSILEMNFKIFFMKCFMVAFTQSRCGVNRFVSAYVFYVACQSGNFCLLGQTLAIFCWILVFHNLHSNFANRFF